jgi:hypothetical protein
MRFLVLSIAVNSYNLFRESLVKDFLNFLLDSFYSDLFIDTSNSHSMLGCVFVFMVDGGLEFKLTHFHTESNDEKVSQD